MRNLNKICFFLKPQYNWVYNKKKKEKKSINCKTNLNVFLEVFNSE